MSPLAEVKNYLDGQKFAKFVKMNFTVMARVMAAFKHNSEWKIVSIPCILTVSLYIHIRLFLYYTIWPAKLQLRRENSLYRVSVYIQSIHFILCNIRASYTYLEWRNQFPKIKGYAGFGSH